MGTCGVMRRRQPLMERNRAPRHGGCRWTALPRMRPESALGRFTKACRCSRFGFSLDATDRTNSMLSYVYPYALAALFVVLGLAWFLFPYAVRKVEVRRLAELCRQHRALVLSFDDGPSKSLTPQVADLLRRSGIRASFFFISERALQHPEIVRQISAEGHDVGSHTAHHLNAWKSLPVAHCRDMAEGHRQIIGLAGKTSLFRPPYGKMTLASLVLARMMRLSLAWWTIDARDSLEQPRSHEDVLERIRAGEGGIVLLHDYDRFPDPDHGDYVLDLIGKIAALASKEDLRFATFSELHGLAASAPGAKSRPFPVRP